MIAFYKEKFKAIVIFIIIITTVTRLPQEDFLWFQPQYFGLQPGCFLIFCQIQASIFLKDFFEVLKFPTEIGVEMRRLSDEKQFFKFSFEVQPVCVS